MTSFFKDLKSTSSGKKISLNWLKQKEVYYCSPVILCHNLSRSLSTSLPLFAQFQSTCLSSSENRRNHARLVSSILLEQSQCPAQGLQRQGAPRCRQETGWLTRSQSLWPLGFGLQPDLLLYGWMSLFYTEEKTTVSACSGLIKTIIILFFVFFRAFWWVEWHGAEMAQSPHSQKLSRANITLRLFDSTWWGSVHAC